MELIRARSADDAWRAAYGMVVPQGGGPTIALQTSPKGDTHEQMHVAIEIEEPRLRWVLSRVPAISPAFALAEVIWILKGSNESGVLNYWFSRLPEFAGSGPTYAGAYGHRLRHHLELDQIKRACDALAARSDSRQVVLQIWDARCDLPKSDGSAMSADVPCNIVSMLKARGGRLEWTQVMRSNDLIRGLPHNIVQFTVLQEVMAGWLGLEVGGYHHWSDSLHVYATATKFSCSSTRTENADVTTGSLVTTLDRGLALVDELYQRMEGLAQDGLSEARIDELGTLGDAPVGYRNWMRVLAAESARRNQHPEHAESLMRACDDPHLTQAWDAWWLRMVGARVPAGRS